MRVRHANKLNERFGKAGSVKEKLSWNMEAVMEKRMLSKLVSKKKTSNTLSLICWLRREASGMFS